MTIELWREDDPSHRVQCQTRSASSSGQCLRYQDHGGDHMYRPLDDAALLLGRTSDEGLLRTFAVLTHRLHAADRARGPQSTALAARMRSQRDLVQVEILRRMSER